MFNVHQKECGWNRPWFSGTVLTSTSWKSSLHEIAYSCLAFWQTHKHTQHHHRKQSYDDIDDERWWKKHRKLQKLSERRRQEITAVDSSREKMF